MINKRHLEDLLASKFLASAILSQFSGVSILEARDDTYGFSCYFKAKQVIHEDLFPYLEQTIKRLIESSQIKCQEMVRDVAINYLKHKGFKTRAEELKDYHQNQILSVLEIGSFVDAVEEELSFEDLLPTLQCFKIIHLQTINSPEQSPSSHHFLLKGICAEDSASLKLQVKKIKEARAGFHLDVMQKNSYVAKFEGLLIELPKSVAFKRNLCGKINAVLEERGYKEIDFSSDLEAVDFKELLFTKPCVVDNKLYFYDNCSTEIFSLEQDLGLYSLVKSKSVTFIDKIETTQNTASIKEMILLVDSLFKSWKLDYKISFYTYLEREKKLIDAKALFQECLQQAHLDNKNEEEGQAESMKGQECQMVFSVEDGFGRVWDLVTLEIQGKKQFFYLEGKLVSIQRLMALLQDVNKFFS